MKKITFLLLFSSFCCTSIAQVSTSRTAVKDKLRYLPIATKSHAQYNKNLQAAFWSDDFSNPANWVVGNNTGDATNWTIGTNPPANPGYTPTLTSTTAANGWAQFDSDGYGETPNDAWIRNTNPINCSAYATVSLQFEQVYKYYSNEQCFVEVSTDSTTWTSTQINLGIAGGQSTANPEPIILNISTTAANQPTVWIRFRYVGNWGYVWSVDDVQLLDTVETSHNLTAIKSVATTTSGYYATMPLSQISPLYFSQSFINNGDTTETNVILTTTVTAPGVGTVYSQTSTAITSLAVAMTDSAILAIPFTPVDTANYSINLTVSGDNVDSNPGDNSDIVAFRVDPTIYIREKTPTYLGNPTEDGTYYGNSFYFPNDASVSTISYMVYQADEGTQIRLMCYRKSPNGLITLLSESDYFVFNAGNALPASVVSVASHSFTNPVFVQSDSTYIFGVEYTMNGATIQPILCSDDLANGSNLIAYIYEPASGWLMSSFPHYVAVEVGAVDTSICQNPYGISVSNLTPTSSDISWISNAPNSNFESGISGFAMGTGTLITDATSPISLTGLQSETSYDVYVQDSCGVGEVSAWVGPYSFSTLASCPAPSSITFSSITYSSATIAWTSGGASSWNIQFGVTGFALGSGTIVPASTNPYTITGLQMGTSYSVYVQDDCGAGDLSSWVGPVSFSTMMNCASFTIPYSQSFEEPSNSFSNICWNTLDQDGDNYNWSIENQASIAHSGTKAAISYSWYNGTVLTPENWLLSPNFDLTAVTGIPVLEYYIGTFDPLYAAEHYKLVASTSGIDPANFTDVLFEETLADTVGKYHRRQIDISAYNGQSVNFAWVHYNSTDMFILTLDDVSLHYQESCPAPENIQLTGSTQTSLSLQWSTGGASNWNMEYGTDGFTFGMGISAPNVSNPITINGLNAETNYSFYIQDSCSVNDLSSWSGPYTFSTLPSCPAPSNLSTSAITDSSATIGWITGGAAAWNLEWGLSGFPLGTGNFVSNATNSYFINGLQTSTTYQVYVQDSCGVGDLSAWTGPLSFSTTGNCGAFSIPYTQGFEEPANNFANICWSLEDGDGDNKNWVISNGGQHGGDKCAKSASFDNQVLTPENWLISPEIDLTTASGTIVLEYYIGAYDPAWAEEHYKLMASTTGSSSGSFTDLLYEETLEAVPGNYFKRVINVSSYIGQTVRFAWVHYDCTDKWFILLDDVYIYENSDIDVGIVQVMAPSNDLSCALSDSEVITVELFNFGGFPAAGFSISYTCPLLNGGLPVTEVVSVTAAPSESFMYTFSTPADMSILGNYSFTFSVSGLTGDINAENNMLAYSVGNNDAEITIHAFTDYQYGQKWYFKNSQTDSIIDQGQQGWSGNVEITERVCVLASGCYEAGVNDVNGMLTGGAYLEILYNGTQVAGSTTPNSFTGPSLVATNLGNGCSTSPDLAVEGKFGFQYVSVPISQITANTFTFGSKVTNSMATYNGINYLQLSIAGTTYTDSVILTSPLSNGATSAQYFPGTFSPASINQYNALFHADVPIDSLPNNNYDTLSFVVSDSTFAREDGIAVSGIGQGGGNKLWLGQHFDIMTDGFAATSVSFAVGGSQLGDSVRVLLYDDFNDLPGSVVGSTNSFIINDNTPNILFNVPLTQPVILHEGKYYVVLYVPEANNGIFIATTDKFFTPLSTWASFDGASWSNLEDYGYNISFLLRLHIQSYVNLALQVTTTDASCSVNDGTASVTVENGTSPFTFLWSNGDTDATADSLAAGTHSIQVVDAEGKTDLKVFNINSSDGAVVTLNTSTNVSCFGGSNGAININVTGGTSPYSYDWSNGATTQDISGLHSGPYDVIVTDDAGCPSSFNITITQKSAITATVSASDATCGSANGSASVSVSGGTSPYTYLWSNNQLNSAIINASPGSYSVVIKDANNCTKTVSGIIINSIGGPVVTLDSLIAGSCSGSGGAIYISVATSFEAVNYTWSSGATTEDLTNIGPGTYSLVVTDSNGCIGNYSKEIFAILPQVQPICLVSVDSASGRNIVMWEKVQSVGVDHYNIFREGNQAGFYYQVGTVPYDSMSSYIDYQANPKTRAYRYKISTTDICGNESARSPYHKTMHMTINQGLGQSYNLIWDHYEGFEFLSYLIYRHTYGIGWELIDSMPNNLTSFTDWPPTITELYYRIAVDVPNPCYTTSTDKVMSGPFSQSFSNMDDNGIIVGDIEIELPGTLAIYPNPFSDFTRIEFTNRDRRPYVLRASSLTGGEVYYEGNITNNYVVFDRGQLSAGYYIIELVGDQLYRGKVVIH